VLWAKSGVGIVATQSLTERSYGPLGLELLEAGKTPEQALSALVAGDPESSVRQVGMVSSEGAAAAHTGERCIPDAGHQVGVGYSVQANIMRNTSIWPRMAEAFEAATGTLAERLLATLDVAEKAGGDWRGMQAAGLLVVEGQAKPWERVFDLRVEDHPEPLKELRRLHDMAAGYRAQSRVEERAKAARAGNLPELDVRFAEILDAAHADEIDRARELLAPLLAEEPRWSVYIRLLGEHDYLPHADELL
jgi:uncharacterized Ntn-hydrolase superfamily protein